MWQVIKRKLVYYLQNYVGQLRQHSCTWGIWWPVTSIFVSNLRRSAFSKNWGYLPSFENSSGCPKVTCSVWKWKPMGISHHYLYPTDSNNMVICVYKFKMAGGQPYSPWAFRLSFRLPTHIDAYLLIYRNLEPALNFPPVPPNHLANVPTLKSSKFWIIYKDDLKKINNILLLLRLILR